MEVEVLDKKEVTELAMVTTIKAPVSQMIVNNEVKVIEGDVTVLYCPHCRSVIQQFQPGITELEVISSLWSDDETKLNGVYYCKHCGKPLRLYRPSPVDAEFTVEDVKETVQE